MAESAQTYDSFDPLKHGEDDKRAGQRTTLRGGAVAPAEKLCGHPSAPTARLKKPRPRFPYTKHKQTGSVPTVPTPTIVSWCRGEALANFRLRAPAVNAVTSPLVN